MWDWPKLKMELLQLWLQCQWCYDCLAVPWAPQGNWFAKAPVAFLAYNVDNQEVMVLHLFTLANIGGDTRHVVFAGDFINERMPPALVQVKLSIMFGETAFSFPKDSPPSTGIPPLFSPLPVTPCGRKPVAPFLLPIPPW